MNFLFECEGVFRIRTAGGPPGVYAVVCPHFFHTLANSFNDAGTI
jgi:hypothetical protein